MTEQKKTWHAEHKAGLSRGQRAADVLRNGMGSWPFVGIFIASMIAWALVNSLVLANNAWDPYPYILLNLFLSMLAAIQAPVIMMSQNRQDTKDRLRGELDFDVNRRAETEIQGVAQKLHLLGDKMGDIEDLLRERLARERGDKG